MAAMAQVPIIPMVVFGGQRILGYGHKDFSRGKTIAITIGEPIMIEKRADAHLQTGHLRDVMSLMLDDTIARYPRIAGEELWWLPTRLGGTALTPDEAKRNRGSALDDDEA